MNSRIRQFLTPGWVLTAVLCVAFAYIAFTVLAPWQLGKNEATQDRNYQLRHAFEVDPVEASELFPDDGSLAEGTEWRRVTVRGEYLPDSDVLMRNRPVDGTPATHALTAFRADDGTLYLVNRGFEPPTDGGSPAMDRAPSGEVELQGYARRGEVTPQRPPLAGGPGEPTQVYGLDTAQVGDIMGLDLHADYIQLAEDQPGSLRAIPLPALESGPYLSYGIQWIFFGIMAPAALVWFIVAEARERRRDREEQEEALRASRDDGAAAAPPEPDPDSGVPAGGDRSADVDALRAKRLAARYGDSGHKGRRGKNHGLDEERF